MDDATGDPLKPVWVIYIVAVRNLNNRLLQTWFHSHKVITLIQTWQWGIRCWRFRLWWLWQLSHPAPHLLPVMVCLCPATPTLSVHSSHLCTQQPLITQSTQHILTSASLTPLPDFLLRDFAAFSCLASRCRPCLCPILPLRLPPGNYLSNSSPSKISTSGLLIPVCQFLTDPLVILSQLPAPHWILPACAVVSLVPNPCLPWPSRPPLWFCLPASAWQNL